jgi:hypothetical protein
VNPRSAYVRHRTDPAAAIRTIGTDTFKETEKMNAISIARFAAGTLLAGCAHAAFAADITMVQPSAANVMLEGGKALVRFTVSGTAASRDHCGYFVEYGDGAAGDSRIIENENGQFNRTHERSFSNPGTYTVRASGKTVKTTSACNGAASATVTVVAAPAGRGGRMAAPTCPEGWMLNEKSVNWRTGAFSCARKPTEQMVCGDGLRYYERDGVIGCAQARRDREERNR